MKKLLVANRGEIARRVFRTARTMGIATVAVYSEADENAPHVQEADEAVSLEGSAPGESYLAVDRVLAAAMATGADAIHPGYGFLSENATFASACALAGLIFVGPTPEVIERMGSKIAAKALMQGAGVPVLPGGVVNDGYRPRDTDYPLLVKASFGGGGRGMRIVNSPEELDDALVSAEREATSAFGDGTVFVERYLVDPRHIEVQIFGDSCGEVIHLFERECSIQRRYQKIVEEAPSPALDDTLREKLCLAAVTAGRTLGYVGAGTVEFVVEANGSFWFLEVNTRLQVEHPVTELVTGLDLVELQLRIAQGERLGVEPTLTGHAIEARLYAEDVDAGFVPVSGRIDRLIVPEKAGIRVDSGYESGSTVSTFYDAMLAKVIAHGRDRKEATRRLGDALIQAEIHGINTNRDLLVGILRHPEFQAGSTDTGFLVRHEPTSLSRREVDPIHLLVGAVAGQAFRRESAEVQRQIPSGWRNVSSDYQSIRYHYSGADFEVRYRIGRNDLKAEISGQRIDCSRVWQVTSEVVELTVAGVRRRYRVHQAGLKVYVDGPDGSSEFREIERFPEPSGGISAGSMQAPMPGSVVRVLVGLGDSVVAGQPLVVLEAMKMEHEVGSEVDGIITELSVAVGSQVENGQVLVVIEPSSDE